MYYIYSGKQVELQLILKQEKKKFWFWVTHIEHSICAPHKSFLYLLLNV